ncbi:hypothetical protein B0T21DRAFT_47717 [Apiosordaria backusii]|uniref:Uncharacterized protein n=1 Tax=Apiosordaria backusii TaxID=314023 RepID=A0AA40AXW0_9PEZI|nr:hypothetical protein B0T21DRAFT_47717 [Apiosordaria backusii]
MLKSQVDNCVKLPNYTYHPADGRRCLGAFQDDTTERVLLSNDARTGPSHDFAKAQLPSVHTYVHTYVHTDDVRRLLGLHMTDDSQEPQLRIRNDVAATCNGFDRRSKGIVSSEEDHHHHVAWLASLCSPVEVAFEISQPWIQEMTRLQLSRADNGRETRVAVNFVDHGCCRGREGHTRGLRLHDSSMFPPRRSAHTHNSASQGKMFRIRETHKNVCGNKIGRSMRGGMGQQVTSPKKTLGPGSTSKGPLQIRQGSPKRSRWVGFVVTT